MVLYFWKVADKILIKKYDILISTSQLLCLKKPFAILSFYLFFGFHWTCRHFYRRINYPCMSAVLTFFELNIKKK